MKASEIAFVVQRYGEGITGGSESLARAVAERLAAEYRITVFTSCAKDYVTWRNELPEGSERLAGVDVLRFRVEEERHLDRFNAFAEPLYLRERTREEELEFLRRQGPQVPKLVEALRKQRDRFAAIVFFTYLYYPTYWGLDAAPERSVLVPTTHDEPPLRFGIYEQVFAAPQAFGFLTPAEEALVRSRFALGERAGFPGRHGHRDARAAGRRGLPRAARARASLRPLRGPHRRGQGLRGAAGLPRAVRSDKADAAELVLIGKLAMSLPSPSGVRYLGFLSEQDKAAAMAGAQAVVCSSPYESLSIVLLEAFALGTPGLVNERSAVLREHCLRSNAGLYYANADEYGEAMDLLVRDRRLRAALAANGRRYVDSEYRWSVVLDRWRSLIEAASGSRRG